MPGYFLDSSALAKLYHSEAGTDRMELLVESPGVRMIISHFPLVEVRIKSGPSLHEIVISDQLAARVTQSLVSS